MKPSRYALVAVLLISGTASGVEFLTQNVIRADEVISDNVVFWGSELTVEGTIEGDLIMMGGQLHISGVVSGDVIAWCGSVSSEGTIGGDARLAAGEIALSGPVLDDVYAVAGKIMLLGNIDGDALLSCGEAVVHGDVGGDLLVGAGSVNLDSRVGGNARFHAGTLRVSETTRIAGVMRYSGVQHATIPDGIAADLIQVPADPKSAVSTTMRVFLHLARLLLKIAGFALLASLVYLLASRVLWAVATPIGQKPARTGMVGAVAAFLVVPLMVALFMVSLLVLAFWGISPGIALWLLAMGLPLALWAWSPLVTGFWLGAFLARTPSGEVPSLRATLLGVLLIVLLGSIPVAGLVVQVVSFVFALGGILLARSVAIPPPDPGAMGDLMCGEEDDL
jgi:cytoskeletal protein CcmA (bactofilin family)